MFDVFFFLGTLVAVCGDAVDQRRRRDSSDGPKESGNPGTRGVQHYTPWDWNICRPIDHPPGTTPMYAKTWQSGFVASGYGVVLGRGRCVVVFGSDPLSI